MLPLFYENFFERDSLLRNDSLLFHAPGDFLTGQWGMPAEPMPEVLYRNNSVVIFLLLCLLLFLAMVLVQRTSIGEQVSAFLFPQPRQSHLSLAVERWSKSVTRMISVVMFSLLAGILYYVYVHRSGSVQSIFSLSTWTLLGIYSGVCCVLLLFRQWMYFFVNSVFFEREQRRLWREDYAFLFSLEVILFLLLAVLVVYFDLPLKKCIWGALIVLLFVKILVLAKDFTYFFKKIYGVLHLFVYFCALEAAPLLVLWTTLDRITQYLTTTY